MGTSRLAAIALTVALLTSCGAESRSDEADAERGDDVELGVQVGDPTQVDEIVLFDDGDRSVTLVDPIDTAAGRNWSVRWTTPDQSGTQSASFSEPLARCAAEELSTTTDPFLAELRARGLNPGLDADGTERGTVVDALLTCDGRTELAELAVASLPDFDADCLGELLTTDQDFVDLYGLQDPDASIDSRRPAAERFGPCLDLLQNAPETLTPTSAQCVRDAQSALGVEMMLGAEDFVRRLVAMFEGCLTPEELADLNLG